VQPRLAGEDRAAGVAVDRRKRCDGRAEAVARLKREVNARIGRFALRSAATLPLTPIYRDPSNEYDICDIRGKICF
jgi:hypothetical protein